MKKKIMLVSAMVLMAMSAMFVACNSNKGNEPVQGCTCDVDGESHYFTLQEMAGYGATTCSDLAAALRGAHAAAAGRAVSVSCR